MYVFLKEAAHHRLKPHYKVTVLENEEQLSASPLEDAHALVIIACPRCPFTEGDAAALCQFVLSGGALLVLAERGGDRASGKPY
jgi:hypothetical protein